MIGARAGDNDQVLALAEALGLPFQVKRLEYNPLCHLGPRLLGRSTISLTPDARAAAVDCEPPDLTISAGHRSVPIVRSLRHRSGGRTRSIHVGFPRVSPRHFDLVIATPQYPIPDHPNLLRIPYAFTRAATNSADPAGEALLATFPQPRRLLLVGGPNLYWRIDEPRLLSGLRDMLEDAEKCGGSVLVTTSPRTPARIEAAIVRILEESNVPSLLSAPGKPPAYSNLLEAADSIWVTADSVSMVSDAIWTGKPLALVPIANSALGRIVTVMDALRPGRRLYPQDLRFFWRALAEIGVNEQPGIPRTSTDEQIRSVLDRVRSLLGSKC
jgi:mitochondrial fission protein ELM1